ncbi:MAG: biopolymer transporter ExbD [Ignavibacteriales bacterium]|nr:biopolymer transporter ExbD [Ignavibacteriales bacterium]
MPKIKKSRIGVKLDMTPMVDVAFLLLTFFMLTTQFKPPEDVQVEIPSSHSVFKLPENDVMIVSIDKDSRIFLGVDAQRVRQRVFSEFAAAHWNDFPLELQKRYGTPENMALLSPSMQVTKEELPNLLVKARTSNPKLRTIIKGDKDAEYGVTQDVMDILQKTNITRFNIVTDLEKN